MSFLDAAKVLDVIKKAENMHASAYSYTTAMSAYKHKGKLDLVISEKKKIVMETGARQQRLLSYVLHQTELISLPILRTKLMALSS